MRKIITIITLIFLGLMVGLIVLAISPPQQITKCTMRQDLTDSAWQDAGFYCPGKGGDCVYENPGTCFGKTCTCGSCCLLDTIYTIVNWVFYFVLASAIIFISLGAYNIMSAGGDPSKVNTGRNYVLYAIIGLIVGLIAKSLPYIAKSIIGA